MKKKSDGIEVDEYLSDQNTLELDYKSSKLPCVL